MYQVEKLTQQIMIAREVCKKFNAVETQAECAGMGWSSRLQW
jgi:hypothetical protein